MPRCNNTFFFVRLTVGAPSSRPPGLLADFISKFFVGDVFRVILCGSRPTFFTAAYLKDFFHRARISSKLGVELSTEFTRERIQSAARLCSSLIILQMIIFYYIFSFLIIYF